MTIGSEFELVSLKIEGESRTTYLSDVLVDCRKGIFHVAITGPVTVFECGDLAVRDCQFWFPPLRESKEYTHEG